MGNIYYKLYNYTVSIKKNIYVYKLFNVNYF